MQLNTRENVVTSTIKNKAHKFTTTVSDKLFKLTIDKLYSDKISAFIRELSCNAYDSHKNNGNEDEPISILLPSRLDPNFKVQDFGTGLGDEETLFEVYCTMFGSTKDDSNEFTGCFGLGCQYTRWYKIYLYF